MAKLEDIVSLCKRRGFIFQGSDVYGGMAGTWDFGPLGVSLKKKLKDLWWQYWVENRNDMYGVDAAIIMNPRTWVASGHAATFSDPLVECKSCHGRFRADKLAKTAEGHDLSTEITGEELIKARIKCPTCGKIEWGEVKPFNMMFQTHVGAVSDSSSIAYLRPETAQGIFTNYKNVVDTIYPDMPFGLAQQGKAFRNEISPRDFVFRSREFEQMEIEYFVNPNNWQQDFDSLLSSTYKFLTKKMGLNTNDIHELDVPEEDRAHYSKKTIDIEFDYPIGREELMGIAYRTDFDLSNIARVSGKNMEYVDKNSKEKFIPHVIEPSFGVERLLMAILSTAYTEVQEDGKTRTYLKFPDNLAPISIIVAPLLKNKPALVEKAKEVYNQLRKKYNNVSLDMSGKIGKVYAKADEIGVPKVVVIDFDTIEKDGQVSVRNRDDASQIRQKADEI